MGGLTLSDAIWNNVGLIQIGCVLLAGLILVGLLARKSARVHAWWVDQIRKLQIELFDPSWKHELEELRARVELLELRCDTLAARKPDSQDPDRRLSQQDDAFVPAEV